MGDSRTLFNPLSKLREQEPSNSIASDSTQNTDGEPKAELWQSIPRAAKTVCFFSSTRGTRLYAAPPVRAKLQELKRKRMENRIMDAADDPTVGNRPLDHPVTSFDPQKNLGLLLTRPPKNAGWGTETAPGHINVSMRSGFGARWLQNRDSVG